VGQDPGEIRQDIERTRAQMGDTVEALGYKTDVKARARDSITGRVESVKSRTPDVKHNARRVKTIAEENPLGLAIGAVAVGFIAGLLVPATSVENERIGPVADQVKDQVKETAQIAVDHGKQAAQDAAQAATQAVKETGQDHAEQAKSDLQEHAQHAAQEVRS